MTGHPLLQFLKSILKHWWALMSCAAFTFLGIWTAYANKGREWVLWSSFLLGIVFLMIAAYRAWLAEHRQLLTTSQTADASIRGLKEELARKHPYDEQAEAAVRKAISKLGDTE